jgi:hypothetical protein
LHVSPLYEFSAEPLEKLSIDVVPLTINFYKATFFMKSMALAIHFKASNEFHVAFGIADLASQRRSNIQAQPTLLIVKSDSAWAGVGMPRGEKVAIVAMNEATVP